MSGGKSLPETENRDTLDGDSTEFVIVARRILESERRLLLSRLHELNLLLGYPQIYTSREHRRQGRE
jgi:hypothetical protein